MAKKKLCSVQKEINEAEKESKKRNAIRWNQRVRISVLLASTKAFGEHPESAGVHSMTNQIMEIIYGD